MASAKHIFALHTSLSLRHWVHLGPEYQAAGASGEMKAATRKNTVPRKYKVRFLKLIDGDRFGTSFSASYNGL